MADTPTDTTATDAAPEGTEGLTDQQLKDAGGVLDALADGATVDAGAEGTKAQPFISFGSEKEFQDAIDARLKDRLQREARKREDAERKASEAAREKALQENEQYKELAEERARKIAELEGSIGELSPFKDRSERYEATLKAQLEAQMEAVPEHIKKLLADRDPVDQLSYLTENREVLMGTQEPPAGVGSNGGRDDSPRSVWDLPADEFRRMQEQVANGERVVPPRT
jgi:myosin heavy subunit